jgi:hypothetical protein
VVAPPCGKFVAKSFLNPFCPVSAAQETKDKDSAHDESFATLPPVANLAENTLLRGNFRAFDRALSFRSQGITLLGKLEADSVGTSCHQHDHQHDQHSYEFRGAHDSLLAFVGMNAIDLSIFD